MVRSRAWLKGKTVMAWLADHLETVLLIALLAVGSSLIILVLFANWGPYRGGDAEAARALLSSMATGLAAILALLVTLSLLATQLSATAYTARITQQRLNDPWLWGVVALYLAAILWSLVVLGASGLTDYRWSLDFVSVAFILTGIALFYLVPFTIAMLKSLSPRAITARLAKLGDREAMEDIIRKASREHQISLFEDAHSALGRSLLDCLSKGREDKAVERGDWILQFGLYACRQGYQEGIEVTEKYLTGLARVARQSGHKFMATFLEGHLIRLQGERRLHQGD